MNQRSAAELRVHTGIHAGAREVLPDGRHVLGADAACDLVISDTGVGDRHAELCIDGTTWVLLPLKPIDGVANDGLLLTPGLAVGLGPVVISVDAAGAPWPSAIPRPAVLAIAANEGRLEPALADSAEALEAAPKPKGADKPRPRLGVIYAWGVLLLVVVAVAVTLTVLLRPAEEAPTASRQPALAGDSKAPEQRIQRVLDELGLAGRADVARSASGGLVVNAMLISETEYEALAGALAQIKPRPGLRVSSEKELVDAVRDAVAAHGEQFAAEYLGAGRFRVRGNVASAAEGEALLRALGAEFPAARGFENALLLPAGMAEAMLALLHDKGFAGARGTWRDDLFVIDTALPPEDVSALKQLLTSIDARYGPWLKFSVNITTPPTVARVEMTLPFSLRGVVGGETPYVVLADGRKVLEGGQVGAWHLAEITSDRVVFDGPQRVSVRR